MRRLGRMSKDNTIDEIIKIVLCIEEVNEGM
jgi:hypothetical protein